MHDGRTFFSRLKGFAAALLILALPASAAGEAIQGIVRRVFDGDTVLLLAGNGEKMHVRLYGIDAPEVRRKDRPGQPGGREAKRALERKVLKAGIRLETSETDDYGRSVGILMLDHRNINEEMVREGHAWAYRRYLGGPYASVFIDAERQARHERLGLWRENRPTPPWEFRRSMQRGR